MKPNMQERYILFYIKRAQFPFFFFRLLVFFFLFPPVSFFVSCVRISKIGLPPRGAHCSIPPTLLLSHLTYLSPTLPARGPLGNVFYPLPRRFVCCICVLTQKLGPG